MTHPARLKEQQLNTEIGKHLNTCRRQLGISQAQAGECVGVSFQQTQKFENGINRISAARLYMLSQLYQMPIAYFFDDSHQDHVQPPHEITLLKHFRQIDSDRQNQFLQIIQILK